MPTVSVNIACYNSAKFILRTLQSVLDQTYKDIEIIIINDGSTDNTQDIVRSFGDKRIKYYYKENEGLSLTRNKGLELSLGKYIAFIDHDDLWMPDKLEKQVHLLEKDQDIDMVYSNFIREYPNGKRIAALKGKQPSGNVFEDFLYNYPVGLSTIIIKKEILTGLGDIFDRKFKIAEDYDVMMRALYRHTAVYINEPLVVYRMHDKRATITYSDRYADEYESAVEKLKKLDPFFLERYKSPLRSLQIKMDYLRGKIMMDKLDFRMARQYVAPHIFMNTKFLLMYIISFMPPQIWKLISRTRSGGFIF